MAKRRKTRKQKVLADLRHNFSHNLIGQAPLAERVKVQFSPGILEGKSSKTVALNAYPYLAQDLLKTGILTLSILAFQILLFALLKNHILTIPGIYY